jgi:chaperone BCS1
LFEDIDAMGDIVKDRDLASDKPKSKDLDLENTIKEFMSKKNKKEKPVNDENNNLSYFLNILDGLNECPGRIIIMTTNKPEHLDNALIRPGRIDFKIHMTKATIDDIKQILEHYWTTEFDNEVPLSWEQKLSHAEIVSFCRMSDNIEDTYFKIDKFVDKGSSSPRFYLNTPVASPPVELNLYDSETQ